jgi:hypothetical protein
MTPRCLLFLAGFLVLICSCQFVHGGDPLHPVDIRSPTLDPAWCGRPGVQKSAICDPDNLLSSGEKDELEGIINRQTNPGSGSGSKVEVDAQEAVLIIKQMPGNFISQHGGPDRASEAYARAVHDKWGVGDTVKQNGILIFLSVMDRKVFISVGNAIMQDVSVLALDLMVRPCPMAWSR